MPRFRFQNLLVIVLLACGSTLHAQQPVAGGNWARVQALPVATKVHVTTDHGGKTCRIFAVTDDALTCARSRNTAGTVLQRTEIQHIKLSHVLRSSLLGAGLFGGVGAIAGGISGHTQPCTTGFCFNIIDGKTVALVIGVGGAAVGGIVGATTDFARGSSIYTRP